MIGGGAIGLAVAWRAAQRGLRVALLDRGELGAGTSHVAAGMLAPVTELTLIERQLLDLGLESASIYPSFVEELRDASGMDPGYLQCGTLLLGRDGDEAQALERELELRRELGLGVERLRPSEARRREPALAPTLRIALAVSGDHAIDPRRLTAALAVACAASGVELRTSTAVDSVQIENGRAAGVALAGGAQLQADQVVVAAGSWSGAIEGIPDEARVPIHPVKGQILRLHDPAGPGLLGHVLRISHGYLVPRGDGHYVLGATMEERGFDTTVTAGAAFELLRDAIELVPGVSELVIDELSAGLRPATPDNLPAIGASAVAGLHWATGHFRNGILLAPLTAEIIAGLLTGEPAPAHELAATVSPARFAATPVRS